jgi:hypothetical protein
MATENNGHSEESIHCRTCEDTAIAQAIDDLIGAGLAIIDREVESCPILYLLSGEIFMLGNDYVTRIW